MEDDKKNQNDQPTKEQQPPDETQVKYREITEEDLKQILDDQEKWVKSKGKKGKQADLSKVNLINVNLSEDNPQKAIFLQEHKKWLESDGKEGKKADLSRANLQEAILCEANLQKAILFEANLQEANLAEANLQEADLGQANLQEAYLRGANLQEAYLFRANLQEANLAEANLQEADLGQANLQKANLTGVNLQKAILVEANLQEAMLYHANMQNTILSGVKGLSDTENLQYANFHGATGLLGNEFAQADVTGVKLPDEIKEFNALDIVKETSQNARKIFFAMLLGCVYSWLTIATTTDVKLLTNTTSSPLPIIGTEIPIAWFYIAAPLVLICLYFYPVTQKAPVIKILRSDRDRT